MAHLFLGITWPAYLLKIDIHTKLAGINFETKFAATWKLLSFFDDCLCIVQFLLQQSSILLQLTDAGVDVQHPISYRLYYCSKQQRKVTLGEIMIAQESSGKLKQVQLSSEVSSDKLR